MDFYSLRLETISVFASFIIAIISVYKAYFEYKKSVKDSRDSLISSLEFHTQNLVNRTEYLEDKYEDSLEIQKKYYKLLNKMDVSMEYMSTIESWIQSYCKCDKEYPKPKVPYLIYDEIKEKILEKRNRSK